MTDNSECLFVKVIVTGVIECKTGLHIGGGADQFAIGADNAIIRDHENRPYIPGSSLKGKLRSLLKSNESNGELIGKVFGKPAGENEERSPTCLIVRDAFIKDNETDVIEVKTENAINRLTGKANPRSMERVQKGTEFNFEIIYDHYANNSGLDGLALVFQGFLLLQDSYLGGSGSRGYGQVGVEVSRILYRCWKHYKGVSNGECVVFPTDGNKDVNPVADPSKIKELMNNKIQECKQENCNVSKR